MPRRYLDYSTTLSPHYCFGELTPLMLMMVMGVVAAQLLFAFNFFYSLAKGKKEII